MLSHDKVHAFYQHIRLHYSDVKVGRDKTGCFSFGTYSFKDFKEALVNVPAFKNRHPSAILKDLRNGQQTVMHIEHIGKRDSGWDDLFEFNEENGQGT
jgi:hypothetical protein